MAGNLANFVRAAILFAGILASVGSAWGQGGEEAGDESVIVRSHVTIDSASLGPRSLLVSFPPEYSDSEDSFPVLYLLDAETHFLHAVGIVRFLAYAGRIPPMMVVGIPNPTVERRKRDLTPPITDQAFAPRFPDAGGADIFLDFLEDEVRTWVGKRYRVREPAILAGHSFGGLVVLRALTSKPDAFQGYIAISPSLWWDNGAFASTVAHELRTTPPSTGDLYMTMAREAADTMAGAQIMVEALSGSSEGTFRWKWSHMESEDHASVTHRSLYDGLDWYFEKWRGERGVNGTQPTAGSQGR